MPYCKRPQGDSNPCSSRERAESWAGLDDGDNVLFDGAEATRPPPIMQELFLTFLSIFNN